jgi:uncharacterized damage-inducible protein DinB
VSSAERSVEPRWLLKALREAANEIEGQVFGLSEEQLCRRPSDDEWSLKETLLHLRDAEESYLHRLQLIVHGEEPELSDIAIEDYPSERDYRSADLYDALMALDRLRRETTHLLWSLSPEEWERGGIHPYRGRLSVHQVARDMNEHDLAHLWQMRRTRRLVEAEVEE